MKIICYFICLKFLFPQRIPNFLREKPKTRDLSKARPSMIGLAKGACPSGTVPIRRTTKEDLLASKLLLNNIHPQATSSFNGSYVSSPLFIFGHEILWSQLVHEKKKR